MIKQNINILLVSVCIILLLIDSSCSGCSKSGIRNRAEKYQSSKTNEDYSLEKSAQKTHFNDNTNKPLQTLNQLFIKYKSAVFMVFTSDGEQVFLGTGFFVSLDGIAVSNYHIFEDTFIGLETIKLADGQSLMVEKVLSSSKENDYIIFKVKLNNSVRFTPLTIASKNPEIGDDVFAIGNPKGFEHTLSKGIVSGYRDEHKLIQTTTEITHGSSGGPLMNMNGEVVGITTGGLGEANLNFAVNIQKLRLNRFNIN